jgi:hypothetical protein
MLHSGWDVFKIKLDGESIVANTQWEWRDDKSSVYPPWQEAGRWCICALGCREPSLVLRNPVAS